MSSRSRPRNGSTRGDRDEHEEEQQIWDSIKVVLKDLAELQKEQIATFNEIKDLEEKAKERSKDDPGGATVAEIDAIQSLYRRYLKLSEDEKRILEISPHDVINRLEILKGLREASSDAQSLSAPVTGTHRSSSSKARKPPKPLGRPSSAASSQAGGGASQSVEKDEKDSVVKEEGGTRAGRSSRGGGGGGGGGSSEGTGGDAAPDSLAPIPGRLKGSSVRSSSVASRRDGTVDRELKAPTDEASEASRGTNAEKAGKLVKGAEVAYKQGKPREDGSQWIQCIITNISLGPSPKKYEVQDPEPEEGGKPGTKYRTSAGQLIAIPAAKEILPEWPIGKQVLARYPETTTFYRAEVLANKKEGKAGEPVCVLRFEEDGGQDMQVPRRYVLDAPRP